MVSRTAPPPPAALPASGGKDRHGTAASSSSPSSSLHAVRKVPAKPWKKPTAAPLPPRPKVYRVDPPGFRLLVQRLTGATELPPRGLLRDAQPSQLDVVPHQLGVLMLPPPPQQLPASSSQVNGHGRLATSSTLESARAFLQGEVPSGETTQAKKTEGRYRAEDHTAGAHSPSLYSAYLSWCNLPLLSPGTMESLDRSTVL